MDLRQQIPIGAEKNLCLGCVPKDAEGNHPYGHTWEFKVCGTCGEYRICLNKEKLTQAELKL